MYVSKEIRARVEAKLAACIEILEKRYNQKFKMPEIVYNGQTRCAGLAHSNKWKIELSAPLLMDPQNVDEMINQTTPHELAHLVCDQVYPHTNETSFQVVGRSFRRTKREVHGPHWQEIMWAMGLNPKRTHNMKVSAESAHINNIRQRVRYDWLCTGCNTTIQLGPKHNKSQELYGSVHHRGCRGHKLVKPGTVVETKKMGNLTIHRTTAPDVPPMQMKVPHIPEPVRPGQFQKLMANPAPAPQLHKLMPTLPASIPTGSKIDICKALYQQNRLLSRAQMLQKFIDIAKCTQAGAGTYYATCKKLYG